MDGRNKLRQLLAPKAAAKLPAPEAMKAVGKTAGAKATFKAIDNQGSTFAQVWNKGVKGAAAVKRGDYKERPHADWHMHGTNADHS